MTSTLRIGLGLLATFVIAFALGFSVAPVQRDAPPLITDDRVSPDPRVFAAALQAVRDYHTTRSRTASAWELSVDPRAGTIQSTWYSDHKGEVKLKVQVLVWASLFRVDVYQNVGLLYPRAAKTYWSTSVERSIQASISRAVSQASSN